MNQYDYYTRDYNTGYTPRLESSTTEDESIQKLSLYKPDEAFEKGIFFANLYDEYKYSPVKLTASDKKESDYNELLKYLFVASDLNLYLDLYPNDESILQLYKDYQRIINKLTNDYEKEHGILSANSINIDESPFSWQNESFPWEVNI